MWNDIPMDDGIKPRSFSKGTSSDLNALMTDPERLLVRGAGVLHKFSERLMHDGIQPVIVDEPFSIELDGITIEGKFDVVFEDRDHRYWIIDWSNKELRYDHQYDRRLAILLAAFSTTTGKVAAGVIVDYIMTFGDFYDFSVRTVDALKDQVLDVTQVAKAITQNIVYKDVGPNCKSCPYKNSCVGIRIVQQKRPVGRPRRRANVPGPQ
jgi:CRISPR/Cas system-associated exonuclease Cas4 (RecB family)